MGVVWAAEDVLLARGVAIKETIWPPDLDQRERADIRERVLREARTAARLSHPRIVSVYDVVEHDERPWLVMQLVPYPSLREVVASNGPLRPARAAEAGLTMLSAIRAAHRAGVLHRDIKPANVLLGPGDEVYLADFGLAVTDGHPAMTTAGVVMGSPAYMAPERARGEPATAATDMWALGATLYACVEGRDPFARRDTIAVLTAIVADQPDAPARAGPLWPAISGLLRKDPEERLDAGSAEEMLRSVRDLCTGLREAEQTGLLTDHHGRLAAAVPGAAGNGTLPAGPAIPAGGRASAPALPAPHPCLVATRPTPRVPAAPATAAAGAATAAAPLSYRAQTEPRPARRAGWLIGSLACLLTVAAVSFTTAVVLAGHPGGDGSAPAATSSGSVAHASAARHQRRGPARPAHAVSVQHDGAKQKPARPRTARTRAPHPGPSGSPPPSPTGPPSSSPPPSPSPSPPSPSPSPPPPSPSPSSSAASSPSARSSSASASAGPSSPPATSSPPSPLLAGPL